MHALSGIRTHDPSVRAGEDGSCLRPRDHCDRLASERAKTVRALDRAATVIGSHPRILFATVYSQSSSYSTL
jgi:hypothetical protein